MSESPSFFREEALEFRARGPAGGGAPLRLDSGRLRWSYWAVLGLVVAGFAAGMLIRTDKTATGPAVVDGDGTFAALLPAVIAPGLETARHLRIEPGRAGHPIHSSLIVEHVQRADADAVAAVGLPPPHVPSILLSGTYTEGESAGSSAPLTRDRARVVLVLQSEPLLTVFTERLTGMLGRGGKER
jgi:hypothetical protein